MTRAWFGIRERFHDWMWASKVTLPRRLARRMPLYFSDPYYVTGVEFDALMERADLVPTVGPRPQTFNCCTTVYVTWPES